MQPKGKWDKCLEAVDRILVQKNDYVWAYRLGGYAWAQKGDLAGRQNTLKNTWN